MLVCKFSKSIADSKITINASIPKGSIVVIHGKSGVGKTTLLRCLAGLDTPDSGIISWGESNYFNHTKNTHITPNERDISYMFQSLALIPTMTAKENIEFANTSTSWPSELSNHLELDSFLQQKPKTLSGGQKQRTALARALVQKTNILLLDEPFSSLDNVLKKKALQFTIEYCKKNNTTCLIVTHELSDLILLADYNLEIKNGSESTIQNTEAYISNSLKNKTGIVIRVTDNGDNSWTNLIKIEKEVIAIQGKPLPLNSIVNLSSLKL